VAADTRKHGPLEGIRVVDLTEGLAGHFCTMLLGDQGADVTKVESAPDGDPARTAEGPRVGGEAIAFLAANRNKRSLLLDLDQEGDQEVLHHLVAQADVFVGTHRPTDATCLGVSWEQLSAASPRLVYCSITGRGETGPQSDLPASWATVEAQSGLMSVTGQSDGPPVNIGVPLIENIAGIFAKDAITAALLRRETSGHGQKIETSLLEAAVAVLGMPASAYLISDLVAGRWGAEHEWHVPWKTFATLDGHVVIACSSEDQWKKICVALERSDLTADPRFATMQARASNRVELYGLLDERVRQQSTDHWITELARAGAAGAPVNSIDQVFADPQVLHRDLVQRVGHSVLGSIAQVGHAQKFSASPCSIRLPPPALGEHTALVRQHVGAQHKSVR
jgi:crotonobetainyl-CoA:carnitine CoA-transferase CaiB-like acyl-CoA transferase